MTAVEATTFAAALKTATRALGRSTALPILSGVRLTVEGLTLRVGCTNLDLAIEATVPTRPSTLDVVVPARPLADFVSHLRDAVEISTLPGELIVKSGGSELTLRTFDAAEWPKPATVIAEPVKLSADDVALLERVVHAAGARDKRPELAGVYFTGHQAVGTDSYRMALATLDADLPVMLIDAGHLASILGGCAEGATVTSDGRVARFETDAGAYTVRCTPTDNYPTQYETMLRKSSAHSLTVEREALLEAVKLTALDRDSDTPTVTLTPERGEARVLVSARQQDLGDSQTYLDAIADFDFAVTFNRSYLCDLLTAAAADAVAFGIETALKPAQVTDGALRLLIMPIRK